ncbi:MAG: hypothetical protein R2941_03095 [Desulfobacterales bacterium]
MHTEPQYWIKPMENQHKIIHGRFPQEHVGESSFFPFLLTFHLFSSKFTNQCTRQAVAWQKSREKESTVNRFDPLCMQDLTTFKAISGKEHPADLTMFQKLSNPSGE